MVVQAERLACSGAPALPAIRDQGSVPFAHAISDNITLDTLVLHSTCMSSLWSSLTFGEGFVLSGPTSGYSKLAPAGLRPDKVTSARQHYFPKDSADNEEQTTGTLLRSMQCNAWYPRPNLRPPSSHSRRRSAMSTICSKSLLACSHEMSSRILRPTCTNAGLASAPHQHQYQHDLRNYGSERG